MFRECDFEYAGISSDIYGLKLCYITNTTDTFATGGEFELKTDSIPKSAEQLLYGLDYSSKPLSFDIEIVNPERAIPFEQAIEIKNWLFGQDGWKNFHTLDERQDYYLKCLLLPIEDIVDGAGLRGFKCTLQNISGFWYGADKTITISHADLHNNNVQCHNGYYWIPFTVTVPEDTLAHIPNGKIIPTLNIHSSGSIINGSSIDYPEFNSLGFGGASEDYSVDLGVTNYATIEDIISAYTNRVPQHNDLSSPDDHIIAAVGWNFNTNQRASITKISPKYGYIAYGVGYKSYYDYTIHHTSGRMFYLEQGKNICYIVNPENIDYITISYTPMYRMGAF